MNVPVTLAGHTANWRFRSSADLDDWLSSLPWAGQGGTRVVRLGSAALGEMIARALRRAVRGHDDGGREAHVAIVPFPAQPTALAILQAATDVQAAGTRDQQVRQLAAALQAWATVAVVLPPESPPPAGLVKQTAELIAQTRKLQAEAHATVIFLDTPAAPIVPDGFDFTVGGPSDAALASDATLWRSYAHARLAWDAAGDLGRAMAWDAGGFARLGVGADDALEGLLNHFAETEYSRLPAAEQAKAKETLRLMFRRLPVKVGPDLTGCGAFWKPPGEIEARPSPWLARAMLRLNVAPDAAFYLRGCLVCAPLAREVLGRCFDLEARERAAGFANRGSLPPPPDAVDRFRKFVERQPGSGAEYYPGECPAKPSDPWAFTVFGEFLNSLPFDPARKYFTNGLRTLRNALAHGHYISWAVLSALRKLERDAV